MNKEKKLLLVICLFVFCILISCTALAEQETLTAADRDQAVTMLREQLVERNGDFTLLVPGKSMTTDEFTKLYQEALAHTGNPKEGDYLAQHMIDCIPEISKTKVDGKDYVQVQLAPLYKSTAAMEQDVDKAVETFFATYPVKDKATQYEKIEAIYDYLCDTITYDNKRKHGTVLYFGEREQENVLIANTTYAALVEGTAVCEGFATAFYRLALEMGIDARVVEGMTSERHAWNIVELDGKYYHLDATWDCSNPGWFNYFLDSELWNHTPESSFLADYAMAETSYEKPEAQVVQSGDYTYSVTYGARILGYSGPRGDVVVPDTLDGIPVVSMMNYRGMPAFYGDGITSITFPEGFRHARNICLTGCNDLREIYLPSTFVWSPDEYTWMETGPKTENVHIAEGNRHVKTVDGAVYTADGKVLLQFLAGAARDTVIVPEGVEKIGPSSFARVTGIRKVVLPEGVKIIDSASFDFCTDLEEINIPETVTDVGQWAFGNTALKELHLPVGISYFDSSATGKCAQLHTITIPEGNPTYFVQDNCLYDLFAPGEARVFVCPAARPEKHLTIPDGVINLASYAFSSSQLETVTLNEGLMGLSNGCFSGSALTEITLPASTYYVMEVAFDGCANLKSVTALNDNIELMPEAFGWFSGEDSAKPLLRGHEGSAIHVFAQTYDFPFEAIE
ncbi:MAG: hypothetical protein E7316_10635 [Clostridiales bacterium]|nr:hypothetical protein [Clostridiales bacterium]